MLILQRTDWWIQTEEELNSLLHEVTEFLLTGRKDNTAAKGYGLLAVRERFESIFGNNSRQAYFDAVYGTGSGLRGVLERFISESKNQLLSATLYSMVDSFLSVAYDEHPNSDYTLMHRDGRDYFAHYRGLLPNSILEREDTFVMGTVLVRSRSSLIETPKPKMREVYVRHPEWLRTSQTALHSSSP